MKRNLPINSKIISLCTLVMMFVVCSCNSSDKPTNKGEVQIREYKVEEFELFFTENKNPTVEQMIKAFGQPKIHTLYIGDSVAKQQGDFKPTLDRSAWIYEIGGGLEFVAIQVDHGRVLDVYSTNRKSKNLTYIRKQAERGSAHQSTTAP